jgi:hypothetical protein
MRADSDSDTENECYAHSEDDGITRAGSKALKDEQAALDNVRHFAVSIQQRFAQRHGKALRLTHTTERRC